MLNMAEKKLSSTQLRDLKSFGSRVNKFGANFAVCNAHGELILLTNGDKFKSDTEQLITVGRQALTGENQQAAIDRDGHTYWFRQQALILGTALAAGPGTPQFAALIDAGGISACAVRNTTGESQDSLQSRLLGEMLNLLAEKFQAVAKTAQQMEMVGTELAQVYEELVLLYKLSTNMRVTESDASFLQTACDSLTEVVSVEGIAVLLEKTVDDRKQLVLAAGSGLIDIDEQTAAVLHNHLLEETNRGKEALLDSEVDSPFRYDWPANMRNIIAVPLYGKDKSSSALPEAVHSDNHIIGLMAAINRIDAKLFNSVAGECAVFVENGRLFKDLKELLIGSLRALTSSIDAKDKYTHGHSERVAFISRWIAERLNEQQPFEEEQIHRIYLAGLLHDIGKIGIDEAVLRKEGRLTEAEMQCIRTHPAIGADILSQISQMRDITPGVLCHHGAQIPLIGKIVGLADSFDAMTSRRTYRDAMTVEQALAEIEKGLNTQFAPEVAKVLLNSNVYELWDTIQDGFTQTYGSSSFSEYGTVAVGTLIR